MTVVKRVSLQVDSMRRRVARWIDPKEPPPDLKWDVPIDFALRGPAELREHLGVTEEMFMFSSGHSMADARGYVLYTALDEIEKTGMYLMRQREFLQGPEVDPRGGRLDRLVQEHILEEQEARERRLIEVLVDLVLFEQTNEQDFYRHFLMLESLNDNLSANHDLEEFYGARSANIDYSIEKTREWIAQIEEKLDLSRSWYLRRRVAIAPVANLHPGRLFSSVRQRLLEAVPLMTDHERMIIGLSYHDGYGRTSAAVHFTASGRGFQRVAGAESRAVFALSMLILAILRRCHVLLEEPEGRVSGKVRDALEGNEPAALIYRMAVRDVAVGDFVLAYGDLAEVIDVRETRFGYRSYQVRYLAERPIPDIAEDWFPARYVQRFYTRDHFFESLDKMIEEGVLPADLRGHLGDLTEDQVQEILRNSLVSTWQVGLRDWVRNRGRREEPNG